MRSRNELTAPNDVRARAVDRFARIDLALVGWLRRTSVPLMRIVLGVVFVWFGWLKVIDYTPATELIAGTVYLFDPDVFVRFLGGVEILIGLGFLLNRAMRLVLLAFTGLMVGTMLTFVMLPEVMFEGYNPLLITVEGGYVAKNVVLLVAGMVVASQLQPARPHTPPRREHGVAAGP
jgi:uncharacterized membrane protein YkgB